jgi:DNA-binding MarR family transcriptional regulator
MAKIDPAQTIVNVLGTEGPMSGQDLKAKSGLDTETLKREVFNLIEQGIVTKDNNTFDVTLEYRADGRDSAPEADSDFDEPAAPAKVAPAKPAPAKVAAAPAKTPAKAPAPKAPAKPAPAKAAKAEPAEGKEPIRYYTKGFDQLTLEELQQREAIWTAAMEANAEEGSEENMLVAEGLERILRRTTRRIRGISSGKMQVRA